MMIAVLLVVPDEYVDTTDDTGLTEPGYLALMSALSGWDVADGPNAAKPGCEHVLAV